MSRKSGRFIAMALLIAAVTVAAAFAASLEKAKTLRANGLLAEAKRELVDVTFDEKNPRETRAEALLLLGDIGLDEHNPEVAKGNWTSLIDQYPETPSATTAKAKLEVLGKLGSTAVSFSKEEAKDYPAGTVLVAGPAEYPWAAREIAAALGPLYRVFDGSLGEAMKEASSSTSVKGVIEVNLKVDDAFESGRVVCYRSAGGRVWEQVVRVTYPGSEEAIARRFTAKLATKVKGMRCPA